MSRVDLLVRSRGRTIAVVEAKALALPPNLLAVAHEQLRRYVQETGSAWSVLADPDLVRVYERDVFGEPVATFSTNLLLQAAGLEAAPHVGEGVLVLALQRWLEDPLRVSAGADNRLSLFVAAIRDSDEILAEAQVA